MLSRRTFLKLSVTSAGPLSLPKFVTPLVIPPAMPRTSRLRIPGSKSLNVAGKPAGRICCANWRTANRGEVAAAGAREVDQRSRRCAEWLPLPPAARRPHEPAELARNRVVGTCLGESRAAEHDDGVEHAVVRESELGLPVVQQQPDWPQLGPGEHVDMGYHGSRPFLGQPGSHTGLLPQQRDSPVTERRASAHAGRHSKPNANALFDGTRHAMADGITWKEDSQ
jgi:hypothetical protein